MSTFILFVFALRSIKFVHSTLTMLILFPFTEELWIIIIISKRCILLAFIYLEWHFKLMNTQLFFIKRWSLNPCFSCTLSSYCIIINMKGRINLSLSNQAYIHWFIVNRFSSRMKLLLFSQCFLWVMCRGFVLL